MKLDKNNMAHRNVWCTTYDDGSLYEEGIFSSRREAREAAAKHNSLKQLRDKIDGPITFEIIGHSMDPVQWGGIRNPSLN